MPDHFYTTNSAERDSAAANDGYSNEGVACYVFGDQHRNTVPLFRLYSPGSGDHFYTTSATERDTNVAGAYKDEGTSCFVFPTQVADSVPLFRLWNNVDDHFYTTNRQERDNAVAHFGYVEDGTPVACYVYPNAEDGAEPLYRLFHTPSPSPHPQGKQFPITLDQHDSVIPADINIDTSVVLWADGRIVVNSKGAEWTDAKGAHVGVVVLLYSDDPTPVWLWTSTPARYLGNAKWLGNPNFTGSFTSTVDADTMSKVGYVVIYHYNAPNDAMTDIKNWLAGAQTVFSAVAGIAKAVAAL